jgi:hypothetical protein
MVGVPDYDYYVAHRKAAHPGEPVMSRSEFHRERTDAASAAAPTASAAAAEPILRPAHQRHSSESWNHPSLKRQHTVLRQKGQKGFQLSLE